MSFDRFEIPCIWIPDGGELSPMIPWSDPAIFSAMFIPDGYQGPRPGYPWIEFGRMTLPVGDVGGPRTAGSMASTARTRPSPSASDTEPPTIALNRLALAPLTPSTGTSGGTSVATNAHPDLAATMRSWSALSDLRATMAAFDALSPANPFVASVAQGIAARSPAWEPGRHGSADESSQPEPAVLRDGLQNGSPDVEIQPVDYTTSDVSNSTARDLV